MKQLVDFDSSTGIFLATNNNNAPYLNVTDIHNQEYFSEVFDEKHDLTAVTTICVDYQQPQLPSLSEITIEQISDGLKAGHFSCTDLVNAYLARIEEVNEEIKAVIEVNPDAISIAEALDHELEHSGPRG